MSGTISRRMHRELVYGAAGGIDFRGQQVAYTTVYADGPTTPLC